MLSFFRNSVKHLPKFTRNYSIPNISPKEFDNVVKKMREYFSAFESCLEVHTQNRLSILAACEDPATIALYNYAGQTWPMPQTGQMWLEYELLKNPEEPGFFCLSTSFRNEPTPIPGRHDLIFPMFEFELKDTFDGMILSMKYMLEHLGFGKAEDFPGGTYEEVCEEFGVTDIDHKVEMQIYEKYGPVFFLKYFPEETSPFWNMKRKGHLSYKCDVIIYGVETIGSAERSTDIEDMRHRFLTISDGQYANTLYSQFTRERVIQELDEFLKFKFFPRSGGGIGVTRLIKGMKLHGLLEKTDF